jgi:hypothetical protein
MAKRIQINETQLKKIIKEAVEGVLKDGQGLQEGIDEKIEGLDNVTRFVDTMKEVARYYKTAYGDKSSYFNLGKALGDLFHFIKEELGIA